MTALVDPARGRLRLEGSVGFTVDGTSGTARGDGAVLRVHADDPVVAWAALAGAAPATTALGHLADLLHGEGLAVELSGPGGRLATVGAGADSALGRVVAGSRHVQPGRPAALRPLVVARVAQSLRQRRRPLLLGLLAVVLVGARRRGRPH